MNAKQKIVSATNAVKRNKNAIKVAAITIPVIVLQHKGIQALNQFLKDNDLYDTYYNENEV